MRFIYNLLKISLFAVGYLFLSPKIILAQVNPDNTVNTTVNQNGNVAEITGGQTEGSNLFHSFQDFAVPTGKVAFFDNAETIENIFSRVTGGDISHIDGAIRANGSASLFLINPAGIIFGEGASLDIGGSFISSTADSILFPDGIEFSANDNQTQPILTINAPIGLGFRDNPGDIINRANSFDDRGTPDALFDDLAIGLRIAQNQTIGLIGGNVLLDGGLVTAAGGRIEVGSVGEDSIVSFTEIESGWNIGYEEVTNFQDIRLTTLALIGSFSENGEVTKDVEVQGSKITLTQGSQIGVFSEVGQAGNVSVLASESVTIDGNSIEIGISTFPSSIFSIINNEASGANSRINIETPQRTNANQVTLSPLQANSRQIATATSNGGNIAINTPRLIVRDGAQINSSTQSQASGGNITIDAAESILLTGTAPTAELNIGRTGITVSMGSFFNPESGESVATTGNAGSINISTKDLIIEQGAIISANTFSQGDGGNATIDVNNLTIDSGGRISAGSILRDEAADNELGKGGNLNILATDAVSVIGTGDINGEPVTSSISTIAEGTKDGGSITLTTNKLATQDGGEISTSATGNEAAGDITIDANTVDLDRGNIRAITTAGEGGNITLNIADNLTLRNESQILAEAVRDASGGNIDIDANFVIAFASQPDGSDIVANAEQGTGGNINVTAESLFGIAQDKAIEGNRSNDINASSDFDLDGNVVIRVLDIEPIQEITELPKNLTDGEQTTTQACQSRGANKPNTLTVKGKGGIVRQPVETLDSEIITIGQYEEEDIESQQLQSDRIKSFPTSQGNITPAQGVAVTKNGEVILTSQHTDTEVSRNYDGFINCYNN